MYTIHIIDPDITPIIDIIRDIDMSMCMGMDIVDRHHLMCWMRR
jgi:hypothetical protein